MPQPPSVEALAAELLRIYGQSWQRIQVAEQRVINDWHGLRRSERLTRLRELQAMVERLMDAADTQALHFTQQQLPTAYSLGAAAAGFPFALTATDEAAISTVAADTYDSLLAATTFVRASTKDLIRRLAKDHVADKVIRGETATQAARDLARTLEGQGIAAVTYRDGSRHGLAEYADVVVRTSSATAYSTATLNAVDRAGVGFVECFDNPSCGLTGHDDPVKPNGQVFPLATAQAYVISHPRCVRSWGGRPDVTSAAEAARARGSASAAQNVDQAAVAVARQEAAIQRAFARRGTVLTDSGARVRSTRHASVLSRRAARLARRAQRLPTP